MLFFTCVLGAAMVVLCVRTLDLDDVCCSLRSHCMDLAGLKMNASAHVCVNR